MGRGAGRRLKLVANLPYNIATPLISNLLAEAAPAVDDDRHNPKGMAERIMARPGRKGLRVAERMGSGPCRAEIFELAAGGVRPRPNSWRSSK